MKGGFRPNSGRKKVVRSKAKVPFCLSISRSDVELVKELRSKGYDITQMFIDSLNRAFMKDFYSTYSK